MMSTVRAVQADSLGRAHLIAKPKKLEINTTVVHVEVLSVMHALKIEFRYPPLVYSYHLVYAIAAIMTWARC